MTQRKPKGERPESWAERQIREAQEAGAFEQLEGAGKPLPDLSGAYDEQWWLKKLVQREQLSMLPPALEIRAKVEHELHAILQLRNEGEVRRRVAELNAEIAKVNRTTTRGPATNVALLDADDVVQRWRSR